MFAVSKFFKREKEAPKDKLPEHIAIIMDGNGRWAKKRGLTRNFGHREGANTLRKIVKFSDKVGIKYLTVYAFSTENWKRPKSEVGTLMNLLLEYLKNAERELAGNSVRIRVIGDVKGLPDEIQREIIRVSESTEANIGLNLTFAINYGSRDEIVNAVKEIIHEVSKKELSISDINESVISSRLYTAGLPDPDLLIRPGGERRISNYLLWQSAYTEFWYTDVLWPDFREKHLLEAISDFQNRNRRFGGI